MSDFLQKTVIQAIDKQSAVLDKIAKNTDKSFNKMKKSSAQVTTGMQGIKSSVMGVQSAVALLGAYATGKFVSAFIAAGSEVEDLTTQFKVLLGSATEAKDRMQDLEKFAQTTPFQLTQIGEASKILQTLTKGALAHGDGLRLVGDTAAATGAEFSNLALHVGRAYDGLRNNRPIGESMARLQELGIVSGGVRAQIENLTKQGLGVQAWEVLKTQLEKNKGGMEELSKTVTGLSSTLKDQMQAAMRKILDSGVWDKFKALLGDAVKKMNEMLASGVFDRIGQGFLSLLEHVDKVVIVGKVFLTVFAAKKLMGIATAVAGFSKTLVTINPVLAALTASVLAIEGALALMEARTDKLAGKDFLTSKEDVQQTRDALTTIKELSKEVESIKSKRTQSANWGGLYSSNVSIQDQEKLKKFDEALKIAKANYGSSFDPSRANLPQLIKGLTVVESKLIEVGKKTEETKKKIAEPPPAAKQGKQKKGTVVDFAEAAEQQKLNREILMLEIEEMTLTAQADTQDKELALLELKFQREMLMEGKTLDWKKARNDLHLKQIDQVDKKWEKEKAKQDKKDRKLIESKKDMEVQAAQGMASNYINAAQAIFGANKKYAVLNKFLAMGEAGINTAVAVTKALPNIPLAVSIGVLGAAQVAKIATTKMADGGISGIVPGNSPSGDHINTSLNSREMVLNTRQQNNLFRMLDNGSSGGGGAVTNQIYYTSSNTINGSAGESLIQQLQDEPDLFFKFLEKAGKERGYERAF